MDPTHPHGKIEHALAPLRLCARPPDPDGEDSRRGAEAQRGGIGRTGNEETANLLSATPLAAAPLKKGNGLNLESIKQSDQNLHFNHQLKRTRSRRQKRIQSGRTNG